MHSEKPKKTVSKAKARKLEDTPGKSSEPGSLFVNTAVAGSTAINFLAQDPARAEKEAAGILEAHKRDNKE